MSNRFDVLERYAPLFEAPEPSFDGLLRRRDRRRRNERITAGVVGIAIFVAAVWLVTTGGPLDRGQSPAVPGGSETGPSVSGPVDRADFEGIGLVGLPPEGVTPSTPTRADLVFSFMFLYGRGDAGRFAGSVHEDGRLIWWRLGPPENPAGVEQRGHLERRLTHEEVEQLRDQVLSTGLFDHDSQLSIAQGLYSGQIQVPDGDRLVTVTWGDCCGQDRGAAAPVTPTPEQATALQRLDARLSGLAWESGEIKAYVASRYSMCLETDQEVGPAPPIDSLSRRAEDLVRSWNLTYRTNADPRLPYYGWCSAVTTEQVRALAQLLEEAGNPERAFGDEVEYDVASKDPDRPDVVVALYPLLPHEV